MPETEVRLLCYCSLVPTRCLALIFPLAVSTKRKVLRDALQRENFYFGTFLRLQITSRIERRDYAEHLVYNFHVTKSFFYCRYRTVAITIICEHLRTKPTILVLKYTASYVTNVWMYKEWRMCIRAMRTSLILVPMSRKTDVACDTWWTRSRRPLCILLNCICSMCACMLCCMCVFSMRLHAYILRASYKGILDKTRCTYDEIWSSTRCVSRRKKNQGERDSLA